MTPELIAQISRLVDDHAKEEFNNGLDLGIAALERYRVILAGNHKLIEPRPLDEIVGWLVRDIEAMKAKRRKVV